MDEENQLIAWLPRAERAALLAVGQTVPLALGQVLDDAGATTRHVHFPRRGFISLVVTVAPHARLEVGMAGREGMLGAHLALGVSTSPLHAVVQGAGLSLSVRTPEFRRLLGSSPALTRLLGRYLHVRTGQLASAAGCMRYHGIEARLARWLLMCQDREGAARFHLTHEFLAYMLGVRREGVTQAAGGLHRRGLVDYRRGDVNVLDRAGLEATACGCYASDEAAYRQFMRPR